MPINHRNQKRKHNRKTNITSKDRHTVWAGECDDRCSFIMVNNKLINWSSSRSFVVFKVEWNVVTGVRRENTSHLDSTDVNDWLRFKHCNIECHFRQLVLLTTHSLSYYNHVANLWQSLTDIWHISPSSPYSRLIASSPFIMRPSICVTVFNQYKCSPGHK